ncbi:MAG: hypothetical protein J7501_01425 [Bdellovibrio sp.]|nr:hypothetical protein [Bdellovibrio sp.]
MHSKTTHHDIRKNIFSAITFSLLVLSMGCAKSGQFPGTSSSDSNQSAGIVEPTPTPSPSPTVSPTPSPTPSYKMAALVWESFSKPERAQWSAYLQDIILNKWNTLLAGADDMADFCPNYSKLSNDQRANTWAQLFAAMAKYESAWSPTSRMQETTMGTDPITGRPVYSEGLLQLSYQDITGWPFCEFDWQKDKNLSSTDPKKTILDPYKNLYCGVGIMAKQITKKGLIKIGSGAYWAVLKTNSQYNKITSIESIVKTLSFCK